MIVVLESPGSEARDKPSGLGLSSLFSAAVYLFREGVGIFKDRWDGLKHFEILKDSYPDDLVPGAMFRPYRVGMEWNLLSSGAGMLIGLNVGLSLLVGSLIVRGVG